MQVSGGPGELVGLYTLAGIVNLAAAMFAAGIALRFRSIQAAPLMQTPVFLILFLTPVYVPIDLVSGWVQSAARVNPLTPVLEAGRELISGGDRRLGACVRRGAGAGGGDGGVGGAGRAEGGGGWGVGG